ncbi:N-6 DNA methylase [Pseudoalteromonas sp. Of7M-16]|uniref:Eco57I restriction-modification methylase domain-containing protein n=1 Tax=Pseudoalteromonas sp. Of7M-16 TaxID=2917756 RepID=UPI001EF53201|nr:N-6 DNA methylase [Pseudoalteromonas sp. Of7M-16]MCG7549031.1 N-6 DNA methylase [Pseudoalteromonas sp. Of7M-16]
MYTELYEQLVKHTNKCASEEELRIAWTTTFSAVGIAFHAERDKNDLLHNQVIIELKNKGLFGGKVTSPAFKNAVYDRLYKYIKRRAIAEGIAEEEYTGIATDGESIAFCFMKNGKIIHHDLMPVSEIAITKVLKALKYNKRRALTTQNLVDDFGHNATVGVGLMNALSNELSLHFQTKGNNKIKMLFKEWQSLFGQVSGLTNDQVSKITKQVGFSAPKMGSESISGLLFIIHTYNALIMKLLGAELVSHLNLTQYKDFCGNLASLEEDNLLRALSHDIEKSQYFETVGIKGFVEEAIFSWYLDSTEENDRKEIIKALKEALIQISLYRFDDLTSARSKDVLKGFYQALVPDVLRKSLGEFYTPDWLVTDTLNRSNQDSWLEKKVLDPTCGSGSFLLQTIRLKRAEADKKGLDPEQTIDALLNTVWGFDLNPLAVQAARVNFLIAISDLVTQCKAKNIELPILLADSVYSPARNPKSDEDVVEYRIGSRTANLLITIPSELAFDRTKLDMVFSLMGSEIEKESDFKTVSQKLIRKRVADTLQLSNWEAPLKETYERVLSLHKKNWNGIWFRIIRNFFWSATAGKFDLIVGNPPWVRWSALPVDYREKVKPTCEAYEIFSETKFHGGNELDISGMITYTASDKWLTNGGKIVFVITQTHFQSPSSQGFRSFKISNTAYLKPTFVEDLKALKPFPDAANKTVIVGFEKVNEPHNPYPVPYTIWQAKSGFKKAIKEHSTIEEVLEGIKRTPMEANPVADSRSPWAIMNIGEFEKTTVIRGKSEWVSGRKGVTADLNGIYMVEILDVDEKRGLVQIETRPQAGKKDIGVAKRFWIEPDTLYPMVKGAADFSEFKFKPKHSLFHIVPNLGITKKFLLEAEDVLENDLPKTYSYLSDYRDLLLDRSTYKARLSKYEFFHIYNVGAYSFSPYKVMWAEQSGSFKAAVCDHQTVPLIGKRPYVPDHKVYFVDCYDKQSAHYICGLLNCSLVRHYIESHTISIQVSNIFKHLDLPSFDKNCKKSILLANISEKLHSTDDKTQFEQLILEANTLALEILV